MVSEGLGISPKSLLRDFRLLYLLLLSSDQFSDAPRSDRCSCYPKFPEHSDLMTTQERTDVGSKVMANSRLHPGLQLPGE